MSDTKTTVKSGHNFTSRYLIRKFTVYAADNIDRNEETLFGNFVFFSMNLKNMPPKCPCKRVKENFTRKQNSKHKIHNIYKETPASESLLNKIAGHHPATSLKIDSGTSVFLRILIYF